MKFFKHSLLLAALTSTALNAATYQEPEITQSDAGFHLVVKFKDHRLHEQLKYAHEASSQVSANSGSDVSVYPVDPNEFLVAIESASGLELNHSRTASLGYDELTLKSTDINSSIKALLATGQFESVEPVFKVYPLNVDVNDPLAKDQYYHKNYGSKHRSSSGFELLHAGFNNNLGRKVRFAVVDSGAWDHEDVQFDGGYNFVSVGIEPDRGRDANPNSKYTRADGTTCQSGHGLAVASIIAATRNNGVGMIGAFPSEQAEIVPVRVLGCYFGGTLDVMEGLLWAAGGDISGVPKINKPVDVANMSLGRVSETGCTRYEQDIFDKVASMGVRVVVAAGNNNIPAAKAAPASCGNVISVGAINRSGDKASFSNYGSGVDVVAEGDTVYVAQLSVDNNNSYSNGGGTSYAAPLVAALVGAMVAQEPTMTGTQAEARLKYTSIRNPSLSLNSNCRFYGCGAGLVQVNPAINPDQAENNKAYTVQHRYAGFSTPADLAWMTQLQPKAAACQTLKYTLGSTGFEKPGVSYKLYVSTNGGAANFLKEVTLPQFIYPTPDNATLSFQRCQNGSCESIVTMNKGSIEKPKVCI